MDSNQNFCRESISLESWTINGFNPQNDENARFNGQQNVAQMKIGANEIGMVTVVTEELFRENYTFLDQINSLETQWLPRI